MNPVAPAVLRSVAGLVSTLQNRYRLDLASLKRKQSNADCSWIGLTLPEKLELTDFFAEIICNLLCLLGITALHQQGKFVSTKPGQEITTANVSRKFTRELSQKLIARDMATGIVNYLELIDIDVAQRMRRPGKRRVVDHL